MATVADYSASFAGYNPSGGGAEEWNMWCQAFVSRCSKMHGTFVRDFETARAARAASGWLNPDPRSAPVGAIGWWLWAPDDHVAVHVGNGVWMMGSRHVSVRFGGVARNAGLVSFDDFQASAGLPFLGWSATNGGNIVPVEIPVAAGNERQVTPGDPANGRSNPTTSSPVVQTVSGGDVGTFDGWIRGENVSGLNVWFRGAFSKKFFWAGSFTDRGTHDLADLNPTTSPPKTAPAGLGSKVRVVTALGGPLNIRIDPDTGGEVVKQLAEGSSVTITEYVRGLPIDGNDIWYRIDGNWGWSGGFTSQSIDGIPEKIKKLPDKSPVETPPTAWTPNDPDMIDLVADDFPAWIKFQVKVDNDDTPATNREAYEYYLKKGQDYQYYPIESHVHWWGDPKEASTHDSIVNYLAGKSDLSVHFVTSPGRITRLVSLKTVAYTTGARSMYAWTSENDPRLTEDGYKIMGWLHYAVEKKNPRLMGENIRLHKEFMSTSCSNIDTAKVRAYANKFRSGVLDPATGLPPEVVVPVPIPTPTPKPTPVDNTAVIGALKDISSALDKIVKHLDK